MKLKLLITLIIISALLPSVGQAQTYTALEPLPCIPGGGVTCPGGAGNLQSTFSFQNYVQYIFNLIIAIAAAAAVFMIVFGGLQYMTTDSWQNKSEGLNKVKNALYGLLLVLTSYLILRTIDPRLVAIPTTLVAPLQVTSSNSFNLEGFFGQLEADARAYHGDMAAFQRNRQASQQQITEAEGRIANINNEIRNALGLTGDADLSDHDIDVLCQNPPVEVRALCGQRLAEDNNISLASQNLILSTALGQMRGTIQHCGAITSAPACFDNLGEQAKISTIFSKYVGQLEPNHVRQLSTYALYAELWFTINREISKKERNLSVPPAQWRGVVVPSLARLRLAVTNYAAIPGADATIAADMQRVRDALTTQVEAITRQYDAPTTTPADAPIM